MKRFLLLRLLPLAVLLWLSTSLYSVDFAEFAYVTRFGQPISVRDGAADAGLHVKWPWPVDSVRRIDRRLQTLDLPAVESLTRDAVNQTVDKTLAVDAFVTWRIPDAGSADRFVRTLGSPEQAKRILAPQINGRLAAVIGTLALDDLVAVADAAAGNERRDRVQKLLLADEFIVSVVGEYGIMIVDFRIRRMSYPEAVRQSINERIRSERGRKVAEYESDGRKRAADLLSAAEKQARTIEAQAKADKTRIEGEADAEADRIRNDAQNQDREFYTFLQKLAAYRTMLSETRDVLLLSSKHPLFDLLLNPPGVPQPAKGP